jgi:hypothetical protein
MGKTKHAQDMQIIRSILSSFFPVVSCALTESRNYSLTGIETVRRFCARWGQNLYGPDLFELFYRYHETKVVWRRTRLKSTITSILMKNLSSSMNGPIWLVYTQKVRFDWWSSDWIWVCRPQPLHAVLHGPELSSISLYSSVNRETCSRPKFDTVRRESR